MSSTMPEATLNTSRLSESPLRRRMHLLRRAHSLSNLGSTNRKIIPGFPDIKHANGKRRDEDRSMDDLSPLEYESGSESQSEPESGGVMKQRSTFRSSGSKKGSTTPPPQAKTPPTRPTVDTSFARSPISFTSKDRSPLSPNSRSWYEFDLAVVAALVSPIGNWLTGGDHIKNLLLVVLLIFYLHQIIEIPWSLYQKARPRRRSPQFPPDPSAPAEARYAHLASAELRRLELFFLLCTLLSPIVGALLLRYATAAVLGDAAVSWFSTGLFILATGMRPWAHLVDRLNERTIELHDFIHYPESAVTQTSLEDRNGELEARVTKLERILTRFRTDIIRSTEEVYEYVDEAVQGLEGRMRDQEEGLEEKLGSVERTIARLHQGHDYRSLPLLAFDWMMNTSHSLVRTLPIRIWPLSYLFPRRRATFTVTSKSITKTSTASPTSTAAMNPIEEEYVVYESYPLLVRPVIFASSLVSRMLSFAMLPFASIMRMIMRKY